MDTPFPLPADETARLAALRRYRVAYTEREEVFDRITDMARSLFGTRRGLLGFIDADRIWYKSGARRAFMPRGHVFCAHTILADDVFVIPDVQADPRFHDNAMALELGVRFYAGAPLITHDGFRIGTLHVADDKPHPDLTAEQREWLRTLAQLAMNELELRRELRARTEAERDLDLVNQLMLAIAEAPGARDALETSLRLIADAVGAVHGTVMTLSPHNDALNMIAAYSPTAFWKGQADYLRRRPVARADSLAGLTLSRNRPVIVEFATSNGQFPHMDRLALEAATCIAVPIIQGGREFTLHFFFAARPEDPDGLASRLHELAAKVRPALVRKLSEERIAVLQSVMLRANDAAIVMLPDNASDPASPLRIAYVNPAMSDITGYAEAELTGKQPTFLSGEAGELAVLEQLESGASLRRELQFRRKDGTAFWADINAIAVDSGGGGRQVVAMLRDTTERRELEQALRERERTFHLMFSSAPVPMMLLDVRNQRYVEVNDAAIALFGYGRDAFLAMSAEAIRAPDELTRYKEMMRTPVPGSGRRGLWRYVKSDGCEVTVDVAVHPFRFEGRAMAIIVTVDVTEQKRVEEQIRRARDAAEAISRAKSDLLANMSHELRTPLNAIIGFSQIMREELFGPLGTPRYTGYVGDILESAHHLLAVINDILDLAKIEANSLQLKEKPINPSDAVTSALRLVRPRADEAGIGLEFSNRVPGIAIFADETALKRVLVNLLANAVKFSEAGTRVSIACDLTGDGGIAIAVADRGIGMAPEEIPVALTPFQQIDIGLRRKYEGTGLGLPIAKQLMDLHGGSLHIESARGVGTTVTILLPARRVIPASDPAVPAAAVTIIAGSIGVAAAIGNSAAMRKSPLGP
ncbi:MAG TPA: PAS domain S-box protein [Stellaceae bacterium]